MAKVINCECGYTARAETDQELLQDIRKHISEQHPDMDPVPSDEDLRSQMVEA